ncbi:MULTISPECIES: hypothetical protein [unclassified Nocardia]|uniref:hypothetical protein n=1 Tax=unclassified Nocardia TaxID=2637762 RepID=UPI001CE43577|nr:MULTISPECIES: hypothetical protein [unclassified Nocardia]
MFRRVHVLLFVVLIATGSYPPAAVAQSRPDGAEALYSPSDKASAQNPAYSPDGKTLLFTIFQDGYNHGGAGLNLMPSSGGAPQVLVRQGDQAAVNLPGSAWNGPTGSIAFSFDVTDQDEIWTLRPGDAPRQVTNHSGATKYTEPGFAPGGDWIVFQENVDQNTPGARGTIWKVRTDGSDPTKLVDGPATNTDNRQPNWSPRGDMIVFQSRTGNSGPWRLITIAPDGSGRRVITGGDGEDTDPSFGPDGNWVVYSSEHGGLANAQIFVTRSDGAGQPVRVTTFDGYDGAPSWSPDGAWIAFESGPKDRAPTALWRIPAPKVN